jgi:hypothetical protein
MSRALLVVCLCALAAAGCGGVTSSDSAKDDGDASAAPFSLEKRQAGALAQSMLIRPADLPQWIRKAGENDSVENRKLPKACKRLGEPPRGWIMGEAESPIFAKFPERAFVASGAALFETEEKARRAFARMVRAARSKQGQECFLASARSGGAGAGISFDRPRVRKLGYRLADRSWGFRWTLRVRGDSGSKMYLTLVFLQERQADSFVLTGRFTEPFERELEMRLGRLVAKRMRVAQDAQAS